MHPKDRQKMCTNCDGRISWDADQCPYCAADQKHTGASKELHHQSLQDSLTSLYSPPYGKKETPFNNPEPPKEQPMLDKRFNSSNTSLGAPTIPINTAAAEQPVDEGKSSFWPILLLSIGTNLLTLGLLQLFFSDKGFLRLEWDSSYWFVYCLAALPVFFFGFKKANGLR